EMSIVSTQPLNPMNRHNLRVQINGAVTLSNEGYWGMSVAQGQSYLFSVAARAAEGFQGPLKVALRSASGQILAQSEITGLSDKWKRQTLELQPTATEAKAQLSISGEGKGTLWLDMVSLTPKQPWKDHGLRPDLSEM